MDQEEKPQWLLDLENRKRKPRLGHETGAGAPCLTCSKCAGLDLHFWRKICKICKCRGDEHDFDDDDFPQFELLFGPNLKRKRNQSTLLRVKLPKQEETETPFEWIPPNTSKELAADYMNSLPSEKLPIKGSAGAAFRKQQLKKQLPLHDIDHKACDELGGLEKEEFEKYLDNLKSCAGQGAVVKLSVQPFNRPTMVSSVADETNNLRAPVSREEVLESNKRSNLQTPSSFIPKNLYNYTKPNPSDSFNNLLVSSTSDLKSVTPRPFVGNSKKSLQGSQYGHSLNDAEAEHDHLGIAVDPQTNSNAIIPENSKIRNVKFSAGYEEQLGQNPEFSSRLTRNASIVPNVSSTPINVSESTTQRDEQEQRENIAYNKSDRSIMSPSQLEVIGCQPSISFSMTAKANSQTAKEFQRESNVLNRFKNLDLSDHEPNDQSAEFSSVPRSSHLQPKMESASLVPFDVAHSEKLNSCVFPHDSVAFSHACHDQTALRHSPANSSSPAANKRQCFKCKEDILFDEVIVTADKIRNEVWHPGCFVCSMCNELLVDLVYFAHGGNLFCGRDFSDLLEIPRCFACDELIFVREYTVAEGHSYHVNHFCCWDCDKALAGLQYVVEDDRPLCLPCYQLNYAKTCSACTGIVAADQQGVSIKNLNFHATDDCFCCTMCRKSLLGGQIAVKENKLLCSQECITKFLQSRS